MSSHKRVHLYDQLCTRLTLTQTVYRTPAQRCPKSRATFGLECIAHIDCAVDYTLKKKRRNNPCTSKIVFSPSQLQFLRAVRVLHIPTANKCSHVCTVCAAEMPCRYWKSHCACFSFIWKIFYASFSSSSSPRRMFHAHSMVGQMCWWPLHDLALWLHIRRSFCLFSSVWTLENKIDYK